MPSKQAQAKTTQRYRVEADTCSNCPHFQFDLELPKWMRETNAERKAAGRIDEYGDEYRKQTNLRCAMGGFAVKKTATCDRHPGA